MCNERIISAVALDGWDRSVSLIDSFTPPPPVEYEAGFAAKPERKRWTRENLFPLPGIKPRLLGQPARILATVYTTDHEMISASGDGGRGTVALATGRDDRMFQ